jgi:hypothetical protein
MDGAVRRALHHGTAWFLAVALALLATGTALASGGSTIASAAPLALGALTVGGGEPVSYWRLPLSAGDKIDVSYDMLGQQNCGYLYLLDPTVTDFNIHQAQPVSSSNVGVGAQSVELVSSFTGVGTLADSIDGSFYSLATVDPNYPAFSSPDGGCRVVTPFSMTVAAEHLTQLTIGSFQTHTSGPKRLFRLDARIESPAGLPHGTCLIERIVHGLPMSLNTPRASRRCPSMMAFAPHASGPRRSGSSTSA